MVAQQTLQFASSGSNPTSPHHIHLKEIKAQIASQLNERWHSRLPKIHWSNIVRNTHYVCYGLYHKSEAIGVAIWSSPVAQNRFKDGKQMLELRRLALSERCPKNTASRCIGIMVKLVKKKFPEITRLISYQDTAVHNGTIYKASNWSNEAETDFASWTTNKRQRNKDQATGKKIRWEWKYATFQRSTTRKPTLCRVLLYLDPGFPNPTTSSDRDDYSSSCSTSSSLSSSASSGSSTATSCTFT